MKAFAPPASHLRRLSASLLSTACCRLAVACLLLTASCQLAVAQAPNAIWEDQINGGYEYVRINAITGVKTTVANLPPMVGFVAADASATNYDLNYYHFIAQ